MATRRATRFDSAGVAAQLNPLGQRLLRAAQIFKQSTGAESELVEFSRAAHGKPNQLQTHLTRMRQDPNASLKVEQAVAYARAAQVSLVWLATGLGDPFSGAFAEPTIGDMGDLPDELLRAVHAAVVLTGCTVETARDAAVLAMERVEAGHRAAPSSADEWLDAVRDALKTLKQKSGERPSARGLKSSIR